MRRTGAKDRHNKVCTSKGMRDRRIRLSAATAIHFYDVQDRLGHDRASTAIDWLMKEAKVAIDALNVDHQEYRLAATTARSEAFRRTPCHESEPTSNFNNHPFAVMNEGESAVQEISSTAPLGFTWNPNYDTGEGFASVRRELLHSSFPPPIAHTSSTANDNEFLGFCFQQETQVQEDDSTSVLHYQD